MLKINALSLTLKYELGDRHSKRIPIMDIEACVGVSDQQEAEQALRKVCVEWRWILD